MGRVHFFSTGAYDMISSYDSQTSQPKCQTKCDINGPKDGKVKENENMKNENFNCKIIVYGV